MTRASIFSRFLAMLIDLAILLLFSAVLFLAALGGYHAGSGRLTFAGLSCILFISSFLSCLISLLYFTYLTMGEGMTAGKRIMGIRVVTGAADTGTERSPGFLRSLVRALAYALSAAIFFIGFLMAFFFKGLTLHDMIAGTEVIRSESPRGDDPPGEDRGPSMAPVVAGGFNNCEEGS